MLRRVQKILCLALVLTLALAAMSPAMAQSVKAKVSSSSAKIYKSASSSAKHVSMKKGTQVTVTAVKGGWAKVKVSGKTGYMPTKYLTKASGSTAKSATSKASKSSKRVAAYVSKDTYVYKSASGGSAKRSIATNTKVYVVGKSGSYYKVQNASGSATGYLKTSCVSKSKVTAKKASKKGNSKAWKSKVVKMDWFKDGKNVLKKGGYGYIYDIDTGVELKIKRMGGHYHADVEPATAADTAKLLRVARGKFSWKSRAVILKAGGKYVACGINTKPHGDQTIHNNNYEGQFCLHMCGSWTHASSKENQYHQNSINRAYRWAHK